MIPRGRNLTMTVVTLAIVVFSAGAFAWTQVLKQEEAPIAGIRFDGAVTPGCDCPREQAELSFTLDRAQPLTATIVDDGGEPVRTLLDAAPRESGRETVTWDGRNDDGDVVPDGEYRLRVELVTPDRTITIPADVRVEGQSSAGRDTQQG